MHALFVGEELGVEYDWLRTKRIFHLSVSGIRSRCMKPRFFITCAIVRICSLQSLLFVCVRLCYVGWLRLSSGGSHPI